MFICAEILKSVEKEEAVFAQNNAYIIAIYN